MEKEAIYRNMRRHQNVTLRHFAYKIILENKRSLRKIKQDNKLADQKIGRLLL